MDSSDAQLQRLLPALVWIQTNLDGDLSLAALAELVQLSPNHFHGVFRDEVGETTRSYVERLRVERAAFLLGIESRSVLDIALDVGFQNHETFTRAFKRHFGKTPSRYREQLATGPRSMGAGARGGWEERTPAAALSNTRLRRFRAIGVAFIRHVGAYETVPVSLWDEILEWGEQSGIIEEPLLLGIGHDSPAVTAADRLRFDACVVVDQPFEAQGRIGYEEIEAGWFATTTHVGPYSTLTDGWSEAFARVLARKDCRSLGLPVFEIYRTHQIRPDDPLNETELCIPVILDG